MTKAVLRTATSSPLGSARVSNGRFRLHTRCRSRRQRLSALSPFINGAGGGGGGLVWRIRFGEFVRFGEKSQQHGSEERLLGIFTFQRISQKGLFDFDSSSSMDCRELTDLSNLGPGSQKKKKRRNERHRRGYMCTADGANPA